MIIGLIILSGLLSVAYGWVTIRQLMAADVGTKRMQEDRGRGHGGRASLFGGGNI